MSLRRIRLHRRAAALALGVLVLAGLGGGGYALGLPFGTSHGRIAEAREREDDGPVAHRRAPSLSIRAQPSHQTVVAGSAVAYRLRVIRGRQPLAALISLAVSRGLPVGVTASFEPRATRSFTATLTVRARRSARPGSYRIRLTARDRLRHRSVWAVVTLTVVLPSQRTFTIGGTAAGLLTPGGAARIDLRLTNPNGVPLKIESLFVRILRVRASGADASHPCTVGDFAVARFSGAYRFKLPASRTTSLSKLGFPPRQWPAVLMLDRPVNQDGCKRASLVLSYSGVATGWQR
jgi:hypothetical protein